MNKQLEHAKQHSRKWRYDFNGDKFSTMCFGKDESRDDVMFNTTVIEQSSGTCHMDLSLCTTRDAQLVIMKDRVSSVSVCP